MPHYVQIKSKSLGTTACVTGPRHLSRSKRFARRTTSGGLLTTPLTPRLTHSARAAQAPCWPLVQTTMHFCLGSPPPKSPLSTPLAVRYVPPRPTLITLPKFACD